MTLQTIFDRMALLDNQLDLAAGGDDVTKGLTAVNWAQDIFEAVAAAERDAVQTEGTLAIAAAAESTAWPAELLRVDEVWMLDANGVPIYELDRIDVVGGHAPNLPWPMSALTYGVTISGMPREYYPQQLKGKLYWAPKPDVAYTVRIYGLWQVSDYTAAADTFGYPDFVAAMIPPIATKFMRIGLDRSTSEVRAEQKEAEKRCLAALRNSKGTKAVSKVYSDYHTE